MSLKLLVAVNRETTKANRSNSCNCDHRAMALPANQRLEKAMASTPPGRRIRPPRGMRSKRVDDILDGGGVDNGIESAIGEGQPWLFIDIMDKGAVGPTVFRQFHPVHTQYRQGFCDQSLRQMRIPAAHKIEHRTCRRQNAAELLSNQSEGSIV